MIVTDALGMAGANVLPRDRVVVEALKAGADVLLDPPDVQLAYRAVLHAVRDGEISEARLDASVRRVLRLKRRRSLNPFVPTAALVRVGSREHQRAAERIAERSITLLRDRTGTLPLSSRTHVFVVGPAVAGPQRLVANLARHGVAADVLATGLDPTRAELDSAVARAHGAPTVVVLTINAGAHPAQRELVRALSAPNRLVAVAERSPYDTRRLSRQRRMPRHL